MLSILQLSTKAKHSYVVHHGICLLDLWNLLMVGSLLNFCICLIHIMIIFSCFTLDIWWMQLIMTNWTKPKMSYTAY